MAGTIRIAADAMGGDNAPEEIVKGVVAAVNSLKNISVILVGRQKEIESCLSGQSYPEGTISIRNADDVISMNDHPVEAIRRKKESSMVKALQMVKNGEADAFISAGNSGAVVVGGQGIIGRIRGIQRPPFAAAIPTKSGCTLLLDSGRELADSGTAGSPRGREHPLCRQIQCAGL